MRARMRSLRPSHATVVAYLALFVALGGTGAYAANTIFSADIVDGEVKTPDLAATAVTNNKLASGAVSLGKMASDSVDASKVVDKSLTGADIDEAKLDAAPLRTRVAQGGCDAAVAGTGAMVKVGSFCMDRYEASVWSKPNGGTQYGVSSDDYPCHDNGQDCNNIYARSVASVPPSRHISWFQAQQALANSGKRLPTNAEWQMAVAGTPDGAPCNVSSSGPINTGSAASCVSRFGTNDMVGNLVEFVADWVHPTTFTCAGSWPDGFGGDMQCLVGAGTTGTPGAVVRGGTWVDGTAAGPFAISGNATPAGSGSGVGFRGAR
jgi:Sulfatase-modifying factor enzyme 1